MKLNTRRVLPKRKAIAFTGSLRHTKVRSRFILYQAIRDLFAISAFVRMLESGRDINKP